MVSNAPNPRQGRLWPSASTAPGAEAARVWAAAHLFASLGWEGRVDRAPACLTCSCRGHTLPGAAAAVTSGVLPLLVMAPALGLAMVHGAVSAKQQSETPAPGGEEPGRGLGSGLRRWQRQSRGAACGRRWAQGSSPGEGR